MKKKLIAGILVAIFMFFIAFFVIDFIIDKTNENSSNEPSSSINEPTNSIDFQKNEYTIIYNANGDNVSGKMTNQTFKTNEEKELFKNEFSRTGYSFKGWNTRADGKGTSYDDKAMFKDDLTSGSITLYAMWDINTYTIEFVYENNDSEKINFTYGELIKKFEKAEAIETKDNFSKWTLASGEAFEFDTNMPAQNLVVYAIYKDQSLIKFEYNNGDNQTVVQGFEGDKIVRPEVNPTRIGYDFVDWYKDKELTQKFDFENTKMSNNDLVIYAGWKAHTYTIEFNSNGGRGEMSIQERAYDDNVALSINAFTKTGYTFIGWKTIEDTLVEDGQTINLTSVDNSLITLFAQWQENTYMLELHANNKTGQSNIETLKYNDTYVLENKFVNEGYTMAGWATSANGEVVYEIGQTISKLAESGTVKLYAIWDEIDKYDVILTINNATKEYKLEKKNGKYIAKEILLEGKNTFNINNYNTNKTHQFEVVVDKKGYYNLIFNLSTQTVEVNCIFECIETGEYEETSDSVDGIDVSDLSKLKDLFNSIDEKYTIETQTYFNFEAVKIINKTYNTDYKQHNIKAVTNDQDNQEAFTLFDVNSTYVETYGSTRVEYSPTYIVDYLGWTRIGENKYKCDRVEVVEHFRQLLTPGLSNEGTYMTYDYITIQINNDGSVTIRLYCSNTQSGKIINEHNDQNNKPQWYMLLAEGTIKDIE